MGDISEADLFMNKDLLSGALGSRATCMNVICNATVLRITPFQQLFEMRQSSARIYVAATKVTVV